MNPIFSIEAGAVTKIKTTTNHIVRSESWPVSLTSARTTEAVPVISVVAIALFVPARQSVHVDPLGGQTDSHVAVPALAHNLHLEVVEATGGGDGVGGSHRARVFMSLSVAFVVYSEVGLRESDVVVFILRK